MNRRSRKQSALGRASVVLATITCGYTAVFHGVWMLVMLLNSPHRARYLAEDLDSPDWFLPIAGLAIVGLVLGVLGVIKPRRHRLLPCLGVLVNFLVACDMAYQWGNS